MSENKESEKKEANNVKDLKATCRTCGSEPMITYGNDIQGKKGLEVECPKCRTGFSLSEW